MGFFFFCRHPDDIDLFSGGISEKIPAGAATGPTFACIIATQFKNIKVGDRFWYENYHPSTGFTPSKKRKTILSSTFVLSFCVHMCLYCNSVAHN